MTPERYTHKVAATILGLDDEDHEDDEEIEKMEVILNAYFKVRSELTPVAQEGTK